MLSDDINIKKYITNKTNADIAIRNWSNNIKRNNDKDIITVTELFSGMSDTSKWKMFKNKRDELPYSSDFLNNDERNRYKGSVLLDEKYAHMGIRLHRSLSLWSKSLVNYSYLDIIIKNTYCVKQFLEAAKTLGDIMKKYNIYICNEWYRYVNLETIVGYKFSISKEDFNEQLDDWVSGDVEHSTGDINGENDFLIKMTEGIYKVLSLQVGKEQIMEKPFEYGVTENDEKLYEFSSSMTYRQYVYGGIWARGGSTNIKSNKFASIADKSVKLSESKNTLFNYADLNKLYVDSLDLRIRQKGKGIRKSERAKLRAILGMDTETYLPMSFLDEKLSLCTRNNKFSTLWMTNKDKHQMIIKDGITSVTGNEWFIPLDQSKFDHQVNRKMLILTLLIIKQILVNNNLFDKDTSRCWFVVADRLTRLNDMGIVESEDKKIKINKGILSGWKWTALLDTLINIGEFMAAISLIKEIIGSYIPYQLNAQGDDDNIKVKKLSHAIMISETYKLFGLEINAAKFFISKTINEYLRKIVEKGLIHGYSSRMVLTFLEVNPIRDQQTSQLQELNSTIKNYADWIKRSDPKGCSAKRVDKTLIDQMLYDITSNVYNNMRTSKVIISDKSLARILDIKYWTSKIYGLNCICIPSGMGKTTLVKKFNLLFEDIDDLVYHRLSFLMDKVNRDQKWILSNKIHRDMIDKYHDKSKILLIHHPDQVNSNWINFGILNGSLGLTEIAKNRDYNAMKIAKENRESLEVYNDNENYFQVNTWKEQNDIIMTLVNKIQHYDGVIDERIVIPKRIYNTIEMSKMTRFRVIYKGKISVGYKHRDYIRDNYPDALDDITWYDDSHCETSIEQLDDLMLSNVSYDTISSIDYYILKHSLSVVINNINFHKFSSKLINLLATPAYLGGFGMSSFVGTTGTYVKLKELEIIPEISYPKSNNIENIVKDISGKYGVEPDVSNIYSSSQSKSKLFKPISTIEFIKVKELSMNRRMYSYRDNILDGVSFVGYIMNNEKIKIPTIIRPIINNRVRIDRIRLESLLSIVRTVKENEIGKLFEELYKNPGSILERRKHLTTELWFDWLLGRIQARRPLRSDLSSDLIGFYYNLNISILTSIDRKNTKIGYPELNQVLRELELVELDRIARVLHRNYNISYLE